MSWALTTSIATAAIPDEQNGQIAFTSTRDGNREIYLMNWDGTAVVNLTKHPATDDWPTTSSPINTGFGVSQFVAFASDRNGDEDLFRVNTVETFFAPFLAQAGSNQTQPAYRPGSASPYAWVSDEEGNDEIYINDGFGGSRETNHPAADTAPAARPFGEPLLAFVSDRDGNNEIYDSALTRLTSNPASDAAPNWSPDGQKIAFETNRDGNFEIYVMNANGTAQANISNHPSSDREPAWSPDGTRIVFQSLRDGDFEIYSMAADGSDPTRLTNSPGGDVNPDWAPFHNRGYPRPKGASPLRASLVPASSACTAPNRTHGAPLSFPSCNPPLQTSGFLTIGTPDSNGAPTRSVGFVQLNVKPTPPEDVRVLSQISDVRCLAAMSPSACTGSNAADGPDYSGYLQIRLTIRRTDRSDGSPMNDSSTMVDHVFYVNTDCVNTIATTEGGVCAVATTTNAIVPGVVQDNQRSTWQLDRVQIYDTGADGDPATAGDETLFMTQGIFIP